MKPVAGIILAGGLASRMGGGDKCLRHLGGRPLLRHVIDSIAPQADMLAISANGDPERFAQFGLTVLGDTIGGFVGPLAGILAGMEWARKESSAQWLVSVAADTPFFPQDLVRRLKSAALHEKKIAVAASNGRRHPVFALWSLTLEPALRDFLERGETYRTAAFAAQHNMAVAEFPMIEWNGRTVDPFFNINTQGDLVGAEKMETERNI